MGQNMQNGGGAFLTPAAEKPVVNATGSMGNQGADGDEDAF